MGMIGAWIKVIVGLFVIGASYIFTQPLFDMLFAMGLAMGGNAAHTANFIDGALGYLPVIIGISFILWGFISASTSEDGSYWG